MEKNIQKILDKLMAEELLAHMFYMGCPVAAKKDEAKIFEKLFIEIAEDELNDHFLSLKKWALDNDFKVPYKMKEYMKLATKDAKRLDSLKDNQSALYYIEKAIESEKDAISSYEEALKNKDLPYELHSILINNMFDEKEHLEKLNTLSYAFDANATLVNW
jgi:ferritin-like protein